MDQNENVSNPPPLSPPLPGNTSFMNRLKIALLPIGGFVGLAIARFLGVPFFRTSDSANSAFQFFQEVQSRATVLEIETPKSLQYVREIATPKSLQYYPKQDEFVLETWTETNSGEFEIRAETVEINRMQLSAASLPGRITMTPKLARKQSVKATQFVGQTRSRRHVSVVYNAVSDKSAIGVFLTNAANAFAVLGFPNFEVLNEMTYGGGYILEFPRPLPDGSILYQIRVGEGQCATDRVNKHYYDCKYRRNSARAYQPAFDRLQLDYAHERFPDGYVKPNMYTCFLDPQACNDPDYRSFLEAYLKRLVMMNPFNDQIELLNPEKVTPFDLVMYDLRQSIVPNMPNGGYDFRTFYDAHVLRNVNVSAIISSQRYRDVSSVRFKDWIINNL